MRRLLILLLPLLSACSEIGPHINFDDNSGVADSVAIDEGQNKMVLLEIFTGTSCPNCPKGRAIADNLLAAHAGSIQVVEVHQGPLAHPAQSGDPDLRASDGNDLASYLGPPPYWPVGAVDRIAYEVSPGNPQLLVDRSLWTSLVASAMDSLLPVAMGATLHYDEGQRRLRATIGLKFLQAVNGALNLTVMLVEDSIVAAQLDGTTLITDYVHHDVLRDIITPVTGTAVGGSKMAGETWYWSFADYELPPDWQARHCRLVAAVARAGSANNVLQSLSKKILP